MLRQSVYDAAMFLILSAFIELKQGLRPVRIGYLRSLIIPNGQGGVYS